MNFMILSCMHAYLSRNTCKYILQKEDHNKKWKYIFSITTNNLNQKLSASIVLTNNDLETALVFVPQTVVLEEFVPTRSYPKPSKGRRCDLHWPKLVVIEITEHQSFIERYSYIRPPRNLLPKRKKTISITYAKCLTQA